MSKYTRDDVKPFSTWKHVRTGSYYTVLGIGMCSTNGHKEHIEESVIYYSQDYQGLRYREVNEFLDGRFVREVPKS